MRTLLALAALTFSAAALAVPMQLTHQGQLNDSAGVPLEGPHALTVSLYDAPAGGALLWSDTVNTNLEGGNFAIILGANPSNPLPDAALNGSVRYVGLTVGAAAELPQRLPLTSVPYAIRAGVARDVQGGVVDASEIRINGTTVINANGEVRAPVSFNDLTDVPADQDTLAALTCTTGQIAAFNGLDWACAAQAPASIDTSTLVGTIDIQNLPVGGGAAEVAAGDHVHSFGQITGQAALSQLPTGTGANEVALGNHGHTLADLSGDLPIARVTGTVPFAQLPTGTAANQVATGNHGHAFSAITGQAAITQLPTGTGATQVALGNHAHAFSAITGSAVIAQLPVGTSSTTVARGDHTHDAAAITSGQLAAARLPNTATFSGAVGTGALTVTGDATVSGAVRVGTTTAACGSGNAGALRFTSNQLQVCANNTWTPMRIGGNALLGTMNIPVGSVGGGWEGTPTVMTRINWPDGIGFSWDDYSEYLAPGQALHARFCATYTDSGDNAGRVLFELRDRESGEVRRAESFGNSWSGAGLIHNECGDWVRTNTLVCGYSWSNTCQLFVEHTQDRLTRVTHAWMEISAR